MLHRESIVQEGAKFHWQSFMKKMGIHWGKILWKPTKKRKSILFIFSITVTIKRIYDTVYWQRFFILSEVL